MSEMVKTEIQCLASQVDIARGTDPDAARGMLWAIARRYGKQTALAVARELCQRIFPVEPVIRPTLLR
jgi:hypothetical protein